jgi:transcriptional regulator with XRE-family HTH domain
MISPAQCRAARTLLSWSVAKLAAAAGLSDGAIDDFELERYEDDAAAAAIERALAEVGVEFLPGDDVRVRALAR